MRSNAPRTLTATAIAAALLTGCSTGDEPAAPVPTEAAGQASPTPTPSAKPEWPDWEWPEGYTFDLPEGITLQEETLEYADEEYPDVPTQTYRRMRLDAPNSPLLEVPDDLISQSPHNEGTLRSVLEFGGRYVVEEYMDSELLYENATPEVKSEWYTEHRFLFDPQQYEYLMSEEVLAEEHPPVLSLGYTRERDPEEGDQENRANGAMVWEPDGQRTTNIDVRLIGASVPDYYDEAVRLTYETSQTFVLRDEEGTLDSATMTATVELDVWPGTSGWGVGNFEMGANVSDISRDL